MSEQIFSELSRIFLEKADVVGEALISFNEDRQKIYQKLEKELKDKFNLRLKNYTPEEVTEGDKHMLWPWGKYVKKGNNEIDFIFTPGVLKEGMIKVRVWDEKEGKEWRERYVEIKNKSLAEVVNELVKIVKEVFTKKNK